jgi:hypothetical protein
MVQEAAWRNAEHDMVWSNRISGANPAGQYVLFALQLTRTRTSGLVPVKKESWKLARLSEVVRMRWFDEFHEESAI